MARNSQVVAAADVGASDVAGTSWHPAAADHYVDGLLPDLTDDQVAEHLVKPEAADAEGLLAAEDSRYSPDGVA